MHGFILVTLCQVVCFSTGVYFDGAIPDGNQLHFFKQANGFFTVCNGRLKYFAKVSAFMGQSGLGRTYPSGSFAARVSMRYQLPKMVSASGCLCMSTVFLRLKISDRIVLSDVNGFFEARVFETVNG